MIQESSIIARPAILIVDDNAHNLTAQKEVLASLDADIVTALSGQEAFVTANNRDFAMILLDVNMPGMDGYETAEMLRLNKSTKHVPLIFVTGISGDEHSEFKGYASGAVDYMYKPVERGLLISKTKIFLDLWNTRVKLEVANTRLVMKNQELDEFVNRLRSGDIQSISGDGTGAKVLQLLDSDIVAENQRLLEELARSNKDFQNFAHGAAHDIKAPLRHMQAYAEIVLEDNSQKLNEESCQHLHYICNGAKRLNALTDNLLLYAKVDAKPLILNAVDLNSVMEYVTDDLADIIEQTSTQLEIEKLPTVNGEDSQLYQVLLNIVSNALKYRKPDITPIIKISCQQITTQVINDLNTTDPHEPAVDKVKIVIEDNGIGFDNSYCEKIFVPFQRLVTRDEFEGSGIGLSTVRRILDRHNGSITAESKPGKGTSFTIILPLAK